MILTLQCKVSKYPKEAPGPLRLWMYLCHPFEKSTTDSQPTVGRNSWGYKNHQRQSTGRWLRVFLCQRFYATIYKSCSLLCLHIRRALNNWLHCFQSWSDRQLAGYICKSPSSAFVMKYFRSDKHLITGSRPNNKQSSLAGLDFITLNTTSLAPGGDVGKISCHTGEWLLVYWP